MKNNYSKENRFDSLCSFQYFMTHGCNGCKKSAKCEEQEWSDIVDKKKNKDKTRKTFKI